VLLFNHFGTTHNIEKLRMEFHETFFWSFVDDSRMDCMENIYKTDEKNSIKISNEFSIHWDFFSCAIFLY